MVGWGWGVVGGIFFSFSFFKIFFLFFAFFSIFKG